MYDIWHYHEELELSLILKGEGTRFIGDNIQKFKPDDLVLVGSKLPHVWKNDIKYYKGDSDLNAEVIYIQFLPEFAGDFFDLPENGSVKRLITLAQRGIHIYGKTRRNIKDLMVKMISSSQTENLYSLLIILKELSLSNEFEVLASSGFTNFYEKVDNEKIGKIYNYIIKNFRDKIVLKEIADLSNMEVSSFCRYFKTITKKTFIEFVNEIRIGYACKLLAEKNLNVTQISFECGFKNISYFNRTFKGQVGKSPLEYQKLYSTPNG